MNRLDIFEIKEAISWNRLLMFFMMIIILFVVECSRESTVAEIRSLSECEKGLIKQEEVYECR